MMPFCGCAKEKAPVKNVILLIGDGMGQNHVEGTKIYCGINSLNMESCPYRGLVNTTSKDGVITDSAAAATAMATGIKVYNSAISKHEGNDLKTVTEYAIENNKSTGIAVTKALNDATPAAFSSHSFFRYDKKNISMQQVNSGIDILMGENDENYTSLMQDISNNGYQYIDSKEDFNDIKSSKIFALFDSLTPDKEPSLAYMTEKAISALDRDNKDGFFLMVEGSKIDSRSHSNDFEGMTKELTAFDQAVKAALDFAEKDGNTLVIVTADHETGNLILPDNPTKESLNNSCFKSGDHTANKVYYFAYGTTADAIPEEIENTDIFHIIMSAFKFSENT